MADYGEIHLPKLSDKERRRVLRWGTIVLTILGIVVLTLSSVTPYVDYLWFALDARQPRIFTVGYETKGLLFLPAFAFSWALMHFSLKRALKLSLVYLETPTGAGQMLISNALHIVQDRGWNIVRIVAPVIAFLMAISFSNEWSTFLAARNATPFGMKDPLYGLDLGFFVFTLPWFKAILTFVFSALFLTTLLTLGIYSGLQLLAAMAKVELGRPNIRLHLGILAGATLLLLAARLYLGAYEFGTVQSSQFTGAGYAASLELNMQRVVAALVGLLALGIFVLARSSGVYKLLFRGGIGVAAAYVIGVLMLPSLVQRLAVEPDKLRKEGPYAERAIRMTRFGYGLDKVQSRNVPIQNEPSAADLAASKATLDNMRLWDPEIVRQSVETLQSFKQFYRFTDVDVDRYTIGGKTTQVMLSPRDIFSQGLPGDSRSWLYERLQYTHGYGVVMSAVNDATAEGDPELLMKDIPQSTSAELPLAEPRIYYSDFRGVNDEVVDEYVLVNSNQPEFDYSSEEAENTTRWSAKGGIPIGGFFRRLALAIVLGDGNLLVSSNVTGDTRLLMRRSILDRCSRIYPFLKLDQDPYIVLIDGKIYWMLDAYTTSDRIPYSAIVEQGGSRVNYIRNSVKIVVDAYSGDTTAYAIQPEEPILKTWRAIYPGLVKDASQLGPQFAAHYRYPEDMFRTQALILTQYHVSDTNTFLNNNDLWEMPSEVGLDENRRPLNPYYVQMTLPGEAKDGFVLMLPLNPRRKANMSGWLAAHCDPERYGEMVLYRFPRGANVGGAEQMEATFAADPKVTQARLQLQGSSRSTTEVIVGNMLVIPVGNSVIYAESYFPVNRQSGSGRPRLKKVILGVNGRVEIGDTYREALDKLFANAQVSTEPQTPVKNEPQGIKQTDLQEVKEALDLLDRADAALRSGDFAKYGQLQKQAREKLRLMTGS